MNCHRAGDLLSPYLEGELSPARAADLEAHVAGCARCRAELADLRRAVGALRTPPPLVQPVGLLAEFRSRLETPARRPHPFFRPPALWLVPAGAIAAGLLIGVVISRSQMLAPRPAGRLASGSPASGPQMASAPHVPSPPELPRPESGQGARAVGSEPRSAAPLAEDAKQATAVVPRSPVSAKAPGGALAFDPSRPVARPDRVGELRDARLPGTKGSVDDSSGNAEPVADAARASGDRSVPRDGAVTTPSLTAQRPMAPAFAGRFGAARAPAPRARPRLLLPPGVAGPGEAPRRTQIASARPSPAPPPPPSSSGLTASGAPPSTGLQAPPRQDSEQSAPGRAWVAVRYITPPPSATGQAAGGAGQELRAASAPDAERAADSAAGARRASKTARPSLALAGVTPALIGMMRRTVRVAVADVPLADLLQQIGASAGVTLLLDPKVPDTMRCHAQLQDVPLYEAIQKVAEATQLVIAPQGTGVILRPRSGEPVNAHAPSWTRDWGTAPETQFGAQGAEGEKKR
jgi:hypothetical protein